MHTTTQTRLSRPAALMIVLGVLALTIPASASAFYGPASGNGETPDGVPSNAGLVTPDHTALNESLAPLSGSNGRVVDTPPSAPISSAPASGDAFDWADAALGAGVVMALVTLGGVALITLRRRTPISSSASAG